MAAIIDPRGVIIQGGWYPVLQFSHRSSDSATVIRVADWRGGEGDKPLTGFIKPDGNLTQDVGEAFSFRIAVNNAVLALIKPFARADGTVLITQGDIAENAIGNDQIQANAVSIGELSREAIDRLIKVGGTTGQVYRKRSDTDFDAEWADATETVTSLPYSSITGRPTLVTQANAEAGQATVAKLWSVQRVWQAIRAFFNKENDEADDALAYENASRGSWTYDTTSAGLGVLVDTGRSIKNGDETLIMTVGGDSQRVAVDALPVNASGFDGNADNSKVHSLQVNGIDFFLAKSGNNDILAIPDEAAQGSARFSADGFRVMGFADARKEEKAGFDNISFDPTSTATVSRGTNGSVKIDAGGGGGGGLNAGQVDARINTWYNSLQIAWSKLTNVPSFATRWPTWAEVTNKPTVISQANAEGGTATAGRLISGQRLLQAFTAFLTRTRVFGLFTNSGNVAFSNTSQGIAAQVDLSGVDTDVTDDEILDLAKETRTSADRDKLLATSATDENSLVLRDVPAAGGAVPAIISQANAEGGTATAGRLISGQRLFQAFTAFLTRTRVFGLFSNNGNVTFANTSDGITASADEPLVVTSLPVPPVRKQGLRVILTHEDDEPRDHYIIGQGYQNGTVIFNLGGHGGDATAIIGYSSDYATAALQNKVFVQYSGTVPAQAARFNTLYFYEPTGVRADGTFIIRSTPQSGFPHLFQVSGINATALTDGAGYRVNLRNAANEYRFAPVRRHIGAYVYDSTEGWEPDPLAPAAWARQGEPEPRTLLAFTRLIDGPAIGISQTDTTIDGFSVGAPILFNPLDLSATTFDLDDNEHGMVQVEATLRITTPAAPSTFSFAPAASTGVANREIEVTAFTFATSLAETTAYAAGQTNGFKVGETPLYAGTSKLGDLELYLAINANNAVGYYLHFDSDGISSTAFSISVNMKASFIHNDAATGVDLTDDAILDLAQATRTSSDRGKFLGVSATNENDLTLLDAPSPGQGGLNQGQVDTRVRALVADPAEQGNTTRWPTSKVPTLATLGGRTAAQVTAAINAASIAWARITGAPATATRWPTYTEVTGTKPPANAEQNVQANFNETSSSSDAFIQNKPTLITQASAEGGSATTPRLISGQRLRQGITAWYRSLSIAWSKITGAPATATRWPTYTEVTGTKPPANAEQNVQSDWNATSGDAFIQNKPTLAPSNAEQNVQADWNQTTTTDDSFIRNKPTIPTVDDDAILDLAQSTRTSADRGKFLGVSSTNENQLDLFDAPSGGGATTFAELTDTPNAYTGQGGRYVAVNGAGDALVFSQAPTGGAAVTDATVLDLAKASRVAADRGKLLGVDNANQNLLALSDLLALESKRSIAGDTSVSTPTGDSGIVHNIAVSGDILFAIVGTGRGVLERWRISTGTRLQTSTLSATGLYTDGTTVWLSSDGVLAAYSASSLSRDNTKDVTLPTPTGFFGLVDMWSNGTTWWVIWQPGGPPPPSNSGTIFAYTFAGARDSAKDITVHTLESLRSLGGFLTGDATTLWVGEIGGSVPTDTIAAFNLSTRMRDEDKDIIVPVRPLTSITAADVVGTTVYYYNAVTQGSPNIVRSATIVTGRQVNFPGTTGNAGKYLAVTAGADGVEYVDAPTGGSVTDDAVLDLAKETRVTGDRGKLLGVSSTNENELALLDAPVGVTDDSVLDLADTTRVTADRGRTLAVSTTNENEVALGYKFQQVTQAAYDAIGTKDANTIYIIIG